ncbi:hypothetical protein STAL104432_09760 [Streptomyces albus]
MTKIRVGLRPQRSDSQPMQPRPTPLITDMMPIEEAATRGPKPTSLANGTWKEMPKMETPAVITTSTHISGSIPVRIASMGVYCLVAGGFLSRAVTVLAGPVRRSGSWSAGHQFFGGSRKNQAHTATRTRTYTPIASSTWR